MTNDLLDRCLLAYWQDGDIPIGSRQRMQSVVFEIAGTIRTWAPPETQARICHLAINETADRLLRESNHIHESDLPCTAPTATPQPNAETAASHKPETTPSNPKSASAFA
jgi:hypothetical protein